MGMVQLANPLFISTLAPTSGATIINATGESKAAIGRVRLQGGSGSKTISAAGGGAIAWAASGSMTHASGSTDFRVGIQDVNASGLEDGGWDVYATLAGGLGLITASSWNLSAMTSGSKTIAHGDLIAVVAEMVTRGGADQILAVTQTGNTLSPTSLPIASPYGTTDTSALTKSTSGLVCMIKFDDGTYGWIEFYSPLTSFDATRSFVTLDSGSTPDEYGALIRVPFPVRLSGFGFMANTDIASADDFELLVYSDPLGTPVVAATITVDADQIFNSLQTWVYGAFTSPPTLTAGVDYVLAVRPTTANSISFGYYDLFSGFDFLKVACPFSSLKVVSRTNQSGAFSETQAYHAPVIVLGVDSVSDGAGGGGGIGGSPVWRRVTRL